MIPTLDHIPVASGDSARQLTGAASAAEGPANAESGARFGDILNSQEGLSAGTENSKPVKTTGSEEGGKELHGGNNLQPEEQAQAQAETSEQDSGNALSGEASAVERQKVAGYESEMPHSMPLPPGLNVAQAAIDGTPAREHVPEKLLAGTAGIADAVQEADVPDVGLLSSVSHAIPLAELEGQIDDGLAQSARLSNPAVSDVLKNEILRQGMGRPGGVDLDASIAGLSMGDEPGDLPLRQVVEINQLRQLQQALTTSRLGSEAADQLVDVGSQSKTNTFNQSQGGLLGTLIPASEPGMPPGLKVSSSGALPTPLNSPNWSNEFVGRVNLFLKQGIQEASLQLTPPDLGRLEIKISTDGDQTRMLFMVQNAAAREAIEQAMPRLKDMLEQGGLQLAHSEVADQSQSGQRDSETEGEGRASTFASTDPAAEVEVRELSVTVSDAIVDYYI